MSDDPFNSLAWQITIGADEAIAESAVDHTALVPAPPRPAPAPAAPTAAPLRRPAPAAAAAPSDDAAIAALRARLSGIESIESLRAALLAYDDCPLKAGAAATVFADGDPNAPLMLIGDAPGIEDDQEGLPFTGEAGRLLDRMLAAIGLDRSGVFLSNTLFWRLPPGRKPTRPEIQQCRPFLERLIALAKPRIIVALGDIAAKSLLDRSEGITSLRGGWVEFHNPADGRRIIAIPTFHPNYLLRSPAQKREAWRDLRTISARLADPSSQ